MFAHEIIIPFQKHFAAPREIIAAVNRQTASDRDFNRRRLIVHADVDPLSGARFQDLGNLQSVVIEAGEVLLD